jgi:hypothetical protein
MDYIINIAKVRTLIHGTHKMKSCQSKQLLFSLISWNTAKRSTATSEFDFIRVTKELILIVDCFFVRQLRNRLIAQVIRHQRYKEPDAV